MKYKKKFQKFLRNHYDTDAWKDPQRFNLAEGFKFLLRISLQLRMEKIWQSEKHWVKSSIHKNMFWEPVDMMKHER